VLIDRDPYNALHARFEGKKLRQIKITLDAWIDYKSLHNITWTDTEGCCNGHDK